jgi:hypothetical protein
MSAARVIWLLFASYLAFALICFFVRRKVSLRPRNWWIPVALAVIPRVTAWTLWPVVDVADVGMVAAVLLLVTSLVCSRTWLVRTSQAELLQELAAACNSVRIPFEQAGHSELKLLLKDGEVKMEAHYLTSGIQLLSLPRSRNAKYVLLVNLLCKRYPLWLPRPVISMTRSPE